MAVPNEHSRRPYNILHCIDGLGGGGSELQLLQTLRHMDRRTFNCTVCHFQPASDLEGEILSLGIPVVNMNLRSPRNWIRAISGLYEIVSKYHIDLIHASTFYANIYAPLVGTIKRIPVVFTMNTTLDAKDYKAADNHWSLWKYRRFLLLRALILRLTNTRVVAVSHSVKESLVRHLGIPRNRIEVVYRGLVPEYYNPRCLPSETILNVKRQLGLDDAYPVLLNTGRLWPEKGHKQMLEAMPHILTHFPKARLLVAGDGPLRYELEKLRDNLGLEQKVQFLGRRNDIAALLSTAHIFLFASFYEGLSNAVVEAMASGKPIVAFNIPMLREVVGEEGAGILVDGRDPVRLGEEVVRLASSPASSQKLGRRGQQVVCQKFDIRRNVRQLEDVYERALSGC